MGLIGVAELAEHGPDQIFALPFKLHVLALRDFVHAAGGLAFEPLLERLLTERALLVALRVFSVVMPADSVLAGRNRHGGRFQCIGRLLGRARHRYQQRRKEEQGKRGTLERVTVKR